MTVKTQRPVPIRCVTERDLVVEAMPLVIDVIVVLIVWALQHIAVY